MPGGINLTLPLPFQTLAVIAVLGQNCVDFRRMIHGVDPARNVFGADGADLYRLGLNVKSVAVLSQTAFVRQRSDLSAADEVDVMNQFLNPGHRRIHVMGRRVEKPGIAVIAPHIICGGHVKVVAEGSPVIAEGGKLLQQIKRFSLPGGGEVGGLYQ